MVLFLLPTLVSSLYLLIYFLIFLIIIAAFYYAIVKIAPAELHNILIGVLIVISIIILCLALINFINGGVGFK